MSVQLTLLEGLAGPGGGGKEKKPPNPLRDFVRWLDTPDGKRFWRQFDNDCARKRRQGNDRIAAWKNIDASALKAGVTWHHDHQPYMTRLWMLAHEAEGFFKTVRLVTREEPEVREVLLGVLDGWGEVVP